MRFVFILMMFFIFSCKGDDKKKLAIIEKQKQNLVWMKELNTNKTKFPGLASHFQTLIDSLSFENDSLNIELKKY